MDENNPFQPIYQLQDKHFDKLGYGIQLGFQGEPQFYRKDIRPTSEKLNIIEPPYLKGKGPRAKLIDKIAPAPKDRSVKIGTEEYNRLLAEYGRSGEYYRQKQTEAGVDWFLDNPITNAYLPATSVYPLAKNTIEGAKSGDFSELGYEALASAPFVKKSTIINTGMRRKGELAKIIPNFGIGAAKLYDYFDFGKRTVDMKNQYEKSKK